MTVCFGRVLGFLERFGGAGSFHDPPKLGPDAAHQLEECIGVVQLVG